MQRGVIDDVHDDLPSGSARYLAVQYRLILDDTIDLRIACALCPCEPEPISPKNMRERAQEAAVDTPTGFVKSAFGTAPTASTSLREAQVE